MSLRIAQLAPPWLTVPPTGYGGIEWIVNALAEGLVARGHDVTMFAPGGSKTSAKLVSPFPEPFGTVAIGQIQPELLHVIDCYARADEFDVIHDHVGLAGPALGAFSPTPVVVTLHGQMVWDMRRLYDRVGHRLNFVAISESQRSEYPELPYVATIPNGIDVESFSFRDTHDGYLAYVGRFSADKGAHLALEVAHRLGMPLVLAGKSAEPNEIEYVRDVVKPVLQATDDFRGEVSETEKREILAGARAVLFPIQWREPFGLVMAEAMASGSPVIAWRNGAVPEVVDDGVTGFIVDSVDEMIDAVKRADDIDPAACRRHVVQKFSASAMVDAYERAFEAVVAR